MDNISTENLKEVSDWCYNTYENVLCRDFGGPPIWPLFVFAILLFLVSSEFGSQDCVDGKCNHYKTVEDIEKTDTISLSIDKIIDRIRLNHTVVDWRRVMFLSIIISSVILFYYYGDLPPGFVFFMLTVIIFVIVYLSHSWVQAHWWKMNDWKIEDALIELRNKSKKYELSNN